jgi:hypothetical protein
MAFLIDRTIFNNVNDHREAEAEILENYPMLLADATADNRAVSTNRQDFIRKQP